MTTPDPTGDALKLAQRFHEPYERLAPSFGYETREASAKPWADVPENNRQLMTAVCAEILRTPTLDQVTLDEVVEVLLTKRDYIADAAAGALTYKDSGDGFIAMAKEDLARIDELLTRIKDRSHDRS